MTMQPCTSIVQFKSRTRPMLRCGEPLFDLNGALVCMRCDAGTILPGELDVDVDPGYPPFRGDPPWQSP